MGTSVGPAPGEDDGGATGSSVVIVACPDGPRRERMNQLQEKLSGTVRHTRSFTRNLLSTVINKESATNPNPKTTSYTYTPSTQIATETKGNSSVVTSTHNLDDSLASTVEKTSGGSAVCLTVPRSGSAAVNSAADPDIVSAGQDEEPGRVHVTYQWGDPRAVPLWFDLDGDGGQLSRAEDVRLLTSLTARAVARKWACDSEETFAFHAHENGEYILKVGVGLVDYELSRGLVTFALVFDGKRIYGDQVHDQTREFMKRTEAAIDFSGPLNQLVERAAEWFEWLLTWSIERREWYEGDRQIYREWVLSRTGRKLWINASQPPAGPPSRIVQVRGIPGQ
jgi:hypothetical protein